MLVINLSGLTFCNIGVGLAVVKPAVDASRPRHGLQRPAATWGKGSPWPGPAGCRERLLRRAASRVWGVFCEDFFLPVRPPPHCKPGSLLTSKGTRRKPAARSSKTCSWRRGDLAPARARRPRRGRQHWGHFPCPRGEGQGQPRARRRTRRLEGRARPPEVWRQRLGAGAAAEPAQPAGRGAGADRSRFVGT